MYTIIQSDDYKKLEKYIDKKTLVQMQSSRHVCYEFNTGYLISFRYYNADTPSKKDDNIFIYMKGDNLVFVTENSYITELISAINKDSNAPQQLFDFFALLTASDIYKLEEFEDKITTIENHLLTEKKLNTENLKRIMGLRNELLKIKRYYEQLGMIIDDLCENRYGVFDKDITSYFVAIGRRGDKLLDSVLHLREYITQVREAYQAQIDIEQNNIMRIFTVITTIFLPLTLIVGWYGMNLKMPEFSWDFGYPIVIGLSVFVCLLSCIIFKIKKWF
ncbi:MAG: CorA family divalent cation transporter [Oscillospiraceae bacterium]